MLLFGWGIYVYSDKQTGNDRIYCNRNAATKRKIRYVRVCLPQCSKEFGLHASAAKCIKF